MDLTRDLVARLRESLAWVSTQLLETVDGLTEGEVRAPSALPGWTRAHILVHLARNAEDHARMAASCRQGGRAHQYPGGAAQREAEIVEGVRQPLGKLVTDVRQSATDVAAAWAALPDPAWDRPIDMLDGEVAAWVGLRSRLSECAVHHVDLHLAYRPRQWPVDVVDVLLPVTVDRMARRIDATDQEFPSVTVRRTDDAGSWILGSGSGDALIEGPGFAVMAWLSGRSWALAPGDLRTGGDRSVVDALPDRFPYG